MSKKNSSVNLKHNFSNKEFFKIYLNFKKKITFLKAKKILVAVSGGADSLALTALAKMCSYDEKIKFFYVLIDHNLRQNSGKEAQLVKKLLKKHQINLKIIKNKKKLKGNIQNFARLVRYDLLIAFCKKNKIKTILTAHNLEDQVETFFIRLSRGSGLQGLSSMRHIFKIEKNINLVRPLLDLKKKDLNKITKAVFKKSYLDPTNTDTKYLRIRIRKMQKLIEDAGIKYKQIFKSIENLGRSRDTLELYFDKIYKKNITKKRKEILIHKKYFYDLNLEMQSKVLIKSIKELTNIYYAPRSKKVINLIYRLNDKKFSLSTLSGCIFLKDKKHIILKKENKN